MKIKTLLLTAAVLMAGALSAQAGTNPGDMIPRAGTAGYIISDRPDVLYRLFGKDPAGLWRLRAKAQSELDKQFEGNRDSDEARQQQAILDYIFNSYEAVERLEIGLLDVTLDGPKYLVYLKTRKDHRIDPKPEFLAEFLQKTESIAGIAYHLYQPKGAETKESPDTPDGPDEGGPDEAPRPAVPVGGMDRFYVAAVAGGLLVSNFESSIRSALETVASGDFSEALAGRAEFKEWMAVRKPHDFSLFLIGRELQAIIERLLPSEEQAGMDTEGVYREVDSWLQLREYRYMVMDIDYDDAANGLEIAAAFKTRKNTRLLEKLAIEPAEFKMLRYVPEGAFLTAGLQLGDAPKTFANLKELAYDAEGWFKELAEGRNRPPEMPEDMPPEEGRMPREKSVPAGNLDLHDLLKAAMQEAGEPEEHSDENPSEVDKMLSELDKQLKEFGTSLDELLSVLGSEVVLYMAPDEARMDAMARGTPGVDDAFRYGNVGLALAIKDIAKAKAIIAAAREKDPEGAFRGFESIQVQGREFNVSAEHPFGWCFTQDALLVAVALGVEDGSEVCVATLKSMCDSASRSTTGPSDAFVRNGSKFIEFDLGLVARIEDKIGKQRVHRLDRYSRPITDSSFTSGLQNLTVALRLKEYKDGVELAMRLTGLPNLGDYFDAGMGMMGSGGDPKQNAYSYSQENLRLLGGALRRQVDDGKPIDLSTLVKDGHIRAGVLQLPFDTRWKGDMAKLGWTTIDQVKRDMDGNLPKWVDADAATMIEDNEKAGYVSLVLAKGDIADWIRNYRTGFIVAYQEKADTMEGHMVLYADGQVGWLSGRVLADALKLNVEGNEVPGEEPKAEDDFWEEDKEDGNKTGKSSGSGGQGGPSLPHDDPWSPSSGPKRNEGEDVGRRTD